MSQKFHKGDLVHVAKDLGPTISHFESDIDAVVMGSYADEYGGNNHDSYTLYLKGHGQCAWYYENQLTLISHDGNKELAQWKAEALAEDREKGSLDWIFEHGRDLFTGPVHGSTITALASCLGLSVDDLWGAHGEGMSYYANARSILEAAQSYLIAGDKDGWVSAAKGMKLRLADYRVG